MLKSLLAELTGFGSDRTVMEAAFALARAHQAHIDALHVRIDARAMAAVHGAGSYLHSSLDNVAEFIARDEEARSQSAQKTYSDACAQNSASVSNRPQPESPTSSFREVTTLANETLHQARLHDLTISARVPEFAADRLDSLIVSAGKPVLIPSPKPPKTVGETVIVAWKNTAEAARTITGAMPILSRAKRVVVVSIIESNIDKDEMRTSAEGLMAQLKLHGVAAELRIPVKASTSTSEAIKNIAYEVDADLIVMGAYGHSRMRELVLGGTTRDLLVNCDISILLTH